MIETKKRVLVSPVGRKQSIKKQNHKREKTEKMQHLCGQFLVFTPKIIPSFDTRINY